MDVEMKVIYCKTLDSEWITMTEPGGTYGEVYTDLDNGRFVYTYTMESHKDMTVLNYLLVGKYHYLRFMKERGKDIARET